MTNVFLVTMGLYVNQFILGLLCEIYYKEAIASFFIKLLLIIEDKKGSGSH